MDISAKLQLKPGQRVALFAEIADVPSTLTEWVETAETPEAADAVIAFVRDRAELDTVAAEAIEAARHGKLAWIAYPKAGQLGTDLNRDTLAKSLNGQGVQPVRQIAIDEIWSALRFRPA